LPAPVVYVGGGVILFLVYYWYKNKQSSSSTSSAATPTASSTAPTDTTGGYGTYGGYATPSTSTAPTDTSTTTTPTDTTGQTGTVPGYTGAVYSPPGSTSISPPITPLGTKAFNVSGQRFTGVSSFIYNGSTYLGINNPAEANKLEHLGVSLVHNPRDPSGRGLFAVIPAGKKTVVRRPVKKPPKKK
ncbi:MAG: hypothetical protein KGI98_17555, partial [Euryarchaeota archaeon]|nr:hypothetical protein [Euryarchaeota archaeon]